jgi:type I restriction enzyme R subunit
MVDEDLETKFKDANDPLRLVFVCAMWMTGFDVPSCSTIYLDKPMRNHTLMQTIARANRVFGEKLNGLIVDYVGVFRDLQKALAIYGSAAGGGISEGDTPVKDKDVLVTQMQEAIAITSNFCAECGVELSRLQAAPGFERVKLLDDAVEAIIVNDESKKKYLSLANNVAKIYKAILPDPSANEFGPSKALIAVLADKIRSLGEEADISEVMDDVDKLLDRSVATESYRIRDDQNRIVDLSQIDFEALKAHFEKSHKRIEAEKLKAAIHKKLTEMILLNKTRINFLEKFQQMIDEYNAGSSNIEMFFTKLLAFAQELNSEQKRGIAEKLNQEELAIFDLLTKPAIKLSQKDEQRVKKVAKELLQTLQREKLVLDWRKRQQARAAVRLTIEEILEKLPRRFTLELYNQKCDLVYQHVYDSYYGLGRSVYKPAA